MLIKKYNSGEDFSWKKLGIYSGSGALAGGVAGLTCGASLAVMGTGTAAVVASGATAGAAAGAVGGFTRETSMAYVVNNQSWSDSWREGAHAAAVEGALGAVGGAAGGAVLASLSGSIATSGGIAAEIVAGRGALAAASEAAFSGLTGGAAAGAVSPMVFGSVEGFERGGIATSWEAIKESATLDNILDGAMVGGAIGTAGGLAGFGIGRATGVIKPYEQVKGLPDARKTDGLLVRTSRPDDVTYGGVETRAGYARHHIKPLSFGGSDTADNIKYGSSGNCVPEYKNECGHGILLFNQLP